MSLRRLVAGLALLAGVVVASEAQADSWTYQQVSGEVQSASYIWVNNPSVNLGAISAYMPSSSCPSCATLTYDSVTGMNQQIYVSASMGYLSPGTVLEVYASTPGGMPGPCGTSWNWAQFTSSAGMVAGGGILIDGIHNVTGCTADLSYNYWVSDQTQLMPGMYTVDLQYTLNGF